VGKKFAENLQTFFSAPHAGEPVMNQSNPHGMFQICSGTQKIACNDFSPHQFYHLPLCYQFSTYVRQRGCSLPGPEQPYPSAGHVVLEHVGHPAVGAAIGLGLLGLGYIYKDNRSGLAGLAVLIAVFAAFGVAEARVAILRPSPSVRIRVPLQPNWRSICVSVGA
jgi:hypothetical protein